jgi:hypothetical protein
MGPVVLLLGISVSLHESGLGRVAILVLTAAGVLFFVIAMARPVHPSTLTEVARRVQPGTRWTTIRARDLPGVTERFPRMGQFTELSGRIAFTESGVTWEPSKRSERFLPVGTQTWDASWRIQARRLRGIGNQVQVTLTKSGTDDTVTLWMHGRGFEIS